jgi:hypothetical protein
MKPAYKRRKGRELENRAATELARIFPGAIRVPLSGAAPGYAGDVKVPGFGLVECKWRADGFRQLYGWLSDYGNAHAALVVKADRKYPLIVMPLEAYCTQIVELKLRITELEYELHNTPMLCDCVFCHDHRAALNAPDAVECVHAYGKEDVEVDGG